MDTNLTLSTNLATAAPYVPEQQRYSDKKVPAVKILDGAATLPSDKAFVAQVVTARLSGTDFPENPSEIAPADRTLRPYNVPMLPFEAEESAIREADEAETTDAVENGTQQPVAAKATEEQVLESTELVATDVSKPAENPVKEGAPA